MSTLRFVTAAWIAGALSATAGAAAEPDAKPARRIGVEVGMSYWEAAGEIEPIAPVLTPDQFGPFDSEGWSVGVRYLLRAAESRSGSLWLGPSLSFFRHSNTVEILMEGELVDLEGDLGLRGLTLGGEAEWLWRGRGVWRPFVLVGVEYQQVDAAVQVGGITNEEYDNARAFGGSAALGIEVRMTRGPGPLFLRTLARARRLDLGHVSWADPGSPPLSGESYEVALGFTWASGKGTGTVSDHGDGRDRPRPPETEPVPAP